MRSDHDFGRIGFISSFDQVPASGFLISAFGLKPFSDCVALNESEAQLLCASKPTLSISHVCTGYLFETLLHFMRSWWPPVDGEKVVWIRFE